MTDPFQTLVAVKPETITAFNETIKIAFGGIASLAAAFGTIYTVLSSRNTRAAKASAKAAEVNTEITAVNTAALEAHTREMKELKAEALEIQSRIGTLHKDLMGELNKVKIAEVKVSKASEQALSHSEETAKAIASYNSRLDGIESDAKKVAGEWREFSLMIESAKKKREGQG